MIDNKKLKATGILYIISAIIYVLYMFAIIRAGYAIIEIVHTILIVATPVLLALYCIKFSKNTIGRVLYLIGFGISSALFIYYSISNLADDFYFNAYVLMDIFFAVIAIAMLTAKIKHNNISIIVGGVAIAIYALLQLLSLVSSLTRGWFDIYDLMYDIYLIIECIALIRLWLYEGGNTLFAKKTTTIKTPLEDNLLSLKQLYDNNIISEEEYNQKKAEILSKL